MFLVAPTASFSTGRAEREVVGVSNYKGCANGPKNGLLGQMLGVLQGVKKLEVRP